MVKSTYTCELRLWLCELRTKSSSLEQSTYVVMCVYSLCLWPCELRTKSRSTKSRSTSPALTPTTNGQEYVYQLCVWPCQLKGPLYPRPLALQLLMVQSPYTHCFPVFVSSRQVKNVVPLSTNSELVVYYSRCVCLPSPLCLAACAEYQVK